MANVSVTIRAVHSTRQLLETTIELEKRSMALYVRFARLFASASELRDFWFGRARDEARHVGALALVTTVLEAEGLLDRPSMVIVDDEAFVHLRDLLDRYQAEADDSMSLDRALAIAVEIEETELEDLVGDLLKALQDRNEYQRCQRLLVHDLSELSYMIEQHCRDSSLLHRCDELVNRHAAELNTVGK
jgi:rubrerythrin